MGLSCRLEKATLDEWEVLSMNGQDEVNIGSKRQATKVREVKAKNQAQTKKW